MTGTDSGTTTDRDAEPRLWKLTAGDVELWLLAGPRQPPALIHLGAAMRRTPAVRAFFEAATGGLIDTANGVPLLPDPAAGWTGAPGWRGVDPTVRWQWQPPESTSDSLTVRYRHPHGHRLTTTLRSFHPGVFAIDTVVQAPPQALGGPVACTVPLPPRAAEALGFSGRWAGELQPQRRPLAGGWHQVNRAGSRSAHDAFPGWLAGDAGFSDDHGEVLAMHLGWFGNYELQVSRTREGRFAAQWLLEPPELPSSHGGTLALPTLYLAWSPTGCNGIRCVFQDAARQLRRDRGSATAARVQLNTWEGVYFDHDLGRLQAMASAAARLGAERFVLDDGWFGRRRDDRRGLGDWTPRPDVYPEGLDPLIEHVNAEGLEFGLWVEPEMVSADSTLFETHPDWVLGPPDQALGRHQYPLDLGHKACFAYLQRALGALLEDQRIASLKWDMNRDVPHAGGRPLVPAVHALLAEVRRNRPGLEVEACASGGGRGDWSALAWCNRVWLSDAHDPDIRLPMMAAYGLFAPPEVMGSHVGPAVSHQTGRRWGLHPRAAMAVLGSMGLELDPLTLSESEQHVIAEYVALHKLHRHWLHDGHLLTLPHPDPGLLAVGVFSRDRDRALICLLQRQPRQQNVPAPLAIRHLHGRLTVRAPLLDPALRHGAGRQPAWLLGEPLDTDGAFLAGHGLTMPILAPLRGLLVEALPAEEPAG